METLLEPKCVTCGNKMPDMEETYLDVCVEVVRIPVFHVRTFLFGHLVGCSMSTKRDVCVCSRSRRSLASHGHLTGADLYLARRCRWFRVHLLTPATLATGAGRVPYSRRTSRRLLMSRLKAAQIDSLCAAMSSIEDRYGRLTLRPRRHGKQTRCVRQRYAIKRLLRSLNWRIFASQVRRPSASRMSKPLQYPLSYGDAEA